MGKLQFASIVDPICKTSQRSQLIPEKSCQSQVSGQKVSSTILSQEIFTKVVSSLSIEEKKRRVPSIDVRTDASMSGWGFHTSEGMSGSGV